MTASTPYGLRKGYRSVSLRASTNAREHVMLNSKRRPGAPVLMAGALCAALVLAGCTPSGGSGAGQGDSKSITVGIEAGSPQGDYFQKAGPQFTKATGIKVKFLAVPHENMH